MPHRLTPKLSHHDHCVTFAGATEDKHVLHYHSCHDNKILRQFRGHTAPITHISQNPADDSVLTSAKDGSVRLWTLQSPGCLAECKTQAPVPVASFDATGLVFSVGATLPDGHHIHLYDARNASAGAFDEFLITPSTIQQQVAIGNTTLKSLQFSPSGNQMLMGTNEGVSFLLDGFKGTIQKAIGTPNEPSVVCFASDDTTVLEGRAGGIVACWNAQSGQGIQSLTTGSPQPITAVASNPKFKQIASGGNDIALWIWPT